MTEEPRNIGQPLGEQAVLDWSNVTPYHGQTLSDHDDKWTTSSISRRFIHRIRAETVLERLTGEDVVLGDPHWYVTATRDQFSHSKSVTTEDEQYVGLDTSVLPVRFGDDVEEHQ